MERYWEQRSDSDDDCERSSVIFPCDEGIVQRVLDFVGAGQHAYMAPVCSLWQECYARVPEHQQLSPGLAGVGTTTIAVRGCTTLCSAAFVSMKRFKQALKSGLQLDRDNINSTSSMGYIFGRAATDEMLKQAREEYGVEMTQQMWTGAANSVDRLHQLYYLECDPLPWLEDSETAAVAAKEGRLDILEFFRSSKSLQCYHER